LHDRKREHCVQEEAGGCYGRDCEHDRDEDRAVQHANGLAVQGVLLEIEHREPDPHRRKDLHERQPPVREQKPQSAEEHRHAADHERERSQTPPRAAQAQDHLLDHRLVAVAHRAHEPPQACR
jgi:hypothetical protein